MTGRDRALIDQLARQFAGGAFLRQIGRTGGISINLKGERLLLDDLRGTHEGWLPNYMAVA